MEERESGGTTELDPPPEGAMDGEDVFGPVVRPKYGTVGAVSTNCEPDNIDEMREFMRHSKQIELILFEQIKQFSSNMPKLQSDVCTGHDEASVYSRLTFLQLQFSRSERQGNCLSCLQQSISKELLFTKLNLILHFNHFLHSLSCVLQKVPMMVILEHLTSR